MLDIMKAIGIIAFMAFLLWVFYLILKRKNQSAVKPLSKNEITRNIKIANTIIIFAIFCLLGSIIVYVLIVRKETGSSYAWIGILPMIPTLIALFVVRSQSKKKLLEFEKN